MTWAFYFDLVTVILIVGISLVFFLALLTCVEVIHRVWQRRVVGAGSKIRSFLLLDGSGSDGKDTPLELRTLLPFLMIPVLALAVRDGMLSGVILVAGIGLVLWLRGVRKQKQQMKIEDQTEQLILHLRSLLSLEHSILGSLKKALAELPKGDLSRAVAQTCSRLEMKQTPGQAYAPMANLPGPIPQRLATLLAESMDTSEEVQMNLLGMLERETEYRRTIQIKLRQNITLVKGTIRVLQGAVVAGLAATLSLPIWREYFLADVPHRILFTFLIAVTGAASLYFEYEVNRLMQGEGI